MSLFDRLDRVTSRVVDHTFSIHFECHPAVRTPNGRPSPDPDREIWQGKGILDEASAYDSIEAGGRQRSGNDFITLHAGNRYELSVDRNRFPQAAEAKQGDRIQFDDLRKFQVAEVRLGGLARVVFGLVALR
jgi:hypothetical protein